jgi:ABC-type Zn uptake system ZnuABC Zn-binding protein ZnuA
MFLHLISHSVNPKLGRDKMKYIRWILLVALLFTLSCKKQEVSQKKPLLLATIHPYELILQQLAGDEFEVSCIIPVNA